MRHYRNISTPTLSPTQGLAVHACSMAIHCAVWSAAFEGLSSCDCSAFASHFCAVRTAAGVIIPVGMRGGVLGDTDATERPGGTQPLMSMVGSTVMHGSTAIDCKPSADSGAFPKAAWR